MLRYNPIISTSLEDLRAQMKGMSSNLSNLNIAEEFRFFLQFENQIIGTFGLKNINRATLEGEIGYGIGEDFQGNGFGSRGLKLFVEKIFAETNLQRLFAYVAKNNMASQKILEKNGFAQEGFFPGLYMINERPTDEILYGISRLPPITFTFRH